MSILRLLLLGTYIAGIVALLLGVAIRFGLPTGTLGPRGALIFAGVCFLCTLATREVAASVESPKAEPKTSSAAD